MPTYTDTFTDTAGVAATSHTPDSGGSWSLALNTVPVITNANRLRANNNASPLNIILYSTLPSSADYSVSVDWYVVSYLGTRLGPVGRWDSATNSGYFAVFSAVSGTIALFRRDSGVDTSLGSVAFSSSLGGAYTLSLEMTGSTIVVKNNGSTLISIVDTSPILSSGAAGLAIRETGGTPTDSIGCHIDTWSATFTAGTVTALSLLFDGISDASLSYQRLIRLTGGFDGIEDTSINFNRARSGNLQIDSIGDFVVRTSAYKGSGLAFDGVGTFSLTPILQTSSNMYILSAGFDGTVDCSISPVLQKQSVIAIDSSSSVVINSVRGITNSLSIDSISDSTIRFNAIASLQLGFDSVSTFNVTVTNANVSYIFTVDITLIDNSVVEFTL